MNDKEFDTLVEYINLLEAELRESSPERSAKIILKRDNFWPLLRKQREVIGILQNDLQTYQAQIAELRAEIASLRSGQKALEVDRRECPNIR